MSSRCSSSPSAVTSSKASLRTGLELGLLALLGLALVALDRPRTTTTAGEGQEDEEHDAAHGPTLRSCHNRSMDERIETTRRIEASPEEVFAAAVRPAGPRRHRRLRHAAGRRRATRSPLSATRFVVHMDREALGDIDWGEYDVTVSITRYEQDREIAWTILGTAATADRPRLRLPPRARRGGEHPRHVVLRLVADPRRLPRQDRLPDHLRGRAQGHPGHPRPHRATGFPRAAPRRLL